MQDLKNELKKVIQKLYHLDFDPEITVSPENIDADYSTNAPLKLAKSLHKPPMDIANELVTDLKSHNSGSERGDEKNFSISQPGFLNITLSNDFLIKHLN
ncbi:hypothetical protein J6X04_03055, partial [Candidatus Saccharibacteria bacterium]|nr:hypothetical protein [Candidatus Saccharibacteria bacterium]